MGIFSKLFNKNEEKLGYKVDLQKTEYENWIEFLENGGTSDEWESLKVKNSWMFKEDKAETYQKYLKEIKYSSDKYYDLLPRIQSNWSKLNQEKDYIGETAKQIEKDCIASIKYYTKMREIDEKYGENSPNNVPAITRLAMLYEKQEKFENAIQVCKNAYILGLDESSRLKRLIKKAKRNPSDDELNIIGHI